jgi:hypothetical protein
MIYLIMMRLTKWVILKNLVGSVHRISVIHSIFKYILLEKLNRTPLKD